MNTKKFIKGIIGLGAMSCIAYLFYKVGESNGEINERFRDKYSDDDDEEEADNYYGTCFEPKYDEPDDGCIAPFSDTSDYSFTSPEKIKGVSKAQMKKLVQNILYRKYISNKTVRDILGVDFDKAAEVLKALENAGYIGADSGNHRMPVYLTYRDYDNLYR